MPAVVLPYAFEQLAQPEVVALTALGNLRSQAVICGRIPRAVWERQP